jgi:hypothetical protein
MTDFDKTTIKTRAFPEGEKQVVPQSNLTADQEKTLEFVKKNARLEEENKKLLEHLKTIEQLRESLKQEQAKAAEMAKKMAALEAKTQNSSELEAQVKKSAELEAKVKELTEVLGKISGIASGKAG